jgi:dynein heavy chain, axonemal
MKNPPLPVKRVMEAVCLLKGLKPQRYKDSATGQWVVDWWETSKKVLSDMYFLDSLKTYDKVGGCWHLFEGIYATAVTQLS